MAEHSHGNLEPVRSPLRPSAPVRWASLLLIVLLALVLVVALVFAW